MSQRRSSSAPQTMKGKGSGEQEHVRGERRRAEQRLERRRVDEQRREGELEGDAPEQQAVAENTPIERSEARSVRAANAVPIWPTTMPRKVIVVACW